MRRPIPASPAAPADLEVTSTGPGYRPDIDGLRAIAVLSVILFHMRLPMFGGGFVGVDVFFVISGYLITRLLLGEALATGRVDLGRFYLRRARRLLPSLLVVVLLTLVGACWLLADDLLEATGESAVYALISLSNLYFWQHSGYFDFGSTLQPLMHTWSLGVEEQFYLTWPAFLIVGIRWLGSRATLLVVLMLGLASFVLGELYLDQRITFPASIATALPKLLTEPASTAFYLTPFRIFEFVVGAVLAWIPARARAEPRLHDALSVLGLLFIAWPVVMLTEEARFPSFNALLPCTGALLLIYAVDGRWVQGALRARPAVYVGQISYTLYLVHWPVIVLYRYWRALPPKALDQLLILALTGALAVAIYHGIEAPIRRPRPQRRSLRPAAFGLACATGVLLLGAFGELIQHGALSGRNTAADGSFVALDLDEINARGRRAIFSEPCLWAPDMHDRRVSARGPWVCNSTAKLQMLSIGNSHEYNAYLLLRNALAPRFDRGELNMTFASTHGRGDNLRCGFNQLPGLPLRSAVPECQWVTSQLLDLEAVARQYDVLVIGAFRPVDWGKIYLDYARELQRIKPSLKLVIVGSVVDIEPYRCIDLVNRTHDPRACLNKALVRYYNPHEEADIRHAWPDLQFFYVDQRQLLCGSGDYESCDIMVDGIPIFLDGHHFQGLAIPKLIKLAEQAGVLAKLDAYIGAQ